MDGPVEFELTRARSKPGETIRVVYRVDSRWQRGTLAATLDAWRALATAKRRRKRLGQRATRKLQARTLALCWGEWRRPTCPQRSRRSEVLIGGTCVCTIEREGERERERARAAGLAFAPRSPNSVAGPASAAKPRHWPAGTPLSTTRSCKGSAWSWPSAA